MTSMEYEDATMSLVPNISPFLFQLFSCHHVDCQYALQVLGYFFHPTLQCSSCHKIGVENGNNIVIICFTMQMMNDDS